MAIAEANDERTRRGGKEPTGLTLVAITGVAALVSINIGILAFLGYRILSGTSEEGSIGSEVKLPVLLILGAMTLILGLVVAAMTYRLLSPKAAKDQQSRALGLPEGSVSAVIALMLVLIFSITSVYLYQNVAESEQGITSTGLTIDQVKQIDAASVISISAVPGTTPTTYDVRTKIDSTASNDFAKTSLNIIGTLLVAVVGFYFGARTSQTSTQKGAAIRKSIPKDARNGRPRRRKARRAPKPGPSSLPQAAPTVETRAPVE